MMLVRTFSLRNHFIEDVSPSQDIGKEDGQEYTFNHEVNQRHAVTTLGNSWMSQCHERLHFQRENEKYVLTENDGSETMDTEVKVRAIDNTQYMFHEALNIACGSAEVDFGKGISTECVIRDDVTKRSRIASHTSQVKSRLVANGNQYGFYAESIWDGKPGEACKERSSVHLSGSVL